MDVFDQTIFPISIVMTPVPNIANEMGQSIFVEINYIIRQLQEIIRKRVDVTGPCQNHPSDEMGR